jgi:hypothetical protein
MYIRGVIVGINGTLTQDGCRVLVRELWISTRALFRGFEIDDGVQEGDVLSVLEAVLRSAVQEAMPLGISVGERGCWWRWRG